MLADLVNGLLATSTGGPEDRRAKPAGLHRPEVADRFGRSERPSGDYERGFATG